MYENETWELCDLPKGRKAIVTKRIYKVKHDGDASLDCFKARLVAKACSQKEGIDYEETIVPTSRMTTIRATIRAFTDSDWAGCYDTHVSHSGNRFMIGSSCVSCFIKKQPTEATSSCEAEYRAAFSATIECVWRRRLFSDLSLEQPYRTC